MTRRNNIAVLLALVLVGAALLAAPTAQARTGTQLSLYNVGTRYVGQPVPMRGYLNYAGTAHNKTILLQRIINGHWKTVDVKYYRANGGYRFAPRVFNHRVTTYFRAVAKKHGHVIKVSKPITVRVKLSSDPTPPAPPPTSPEVLPDLVVNKLNGCSQAERDESTAGGGVDCFYIVHTNPTNDPTLPGDKKLLKFAATTWNIGDGRMEVRSTRDNPQDGTQSWHDTKTVQRIWHKDGSTTDRDITASTDFYWANLPVSGTDNHGHHHWHIADFDSYSILGESVAQEKHGFCIQDGPSLAGRGPSLYPEATSCGFGNENATSIVHGLTPLWGDTYPSNLQDQGIDIAGLDNTCNDPTTSVPGACSITVVVTADAANRLKESDETDNVASADVEYMNDQVISVIPHKGYQP